LIIQRFTTKIAGWGWWRTYVHDSEAGVRSHGHLADHVAGYVQHPPSGQNRTHYFGALHVGVDTDRRVIAHECLHLACGAWRQHQPRVDLGRRPGPRYHPFTSPEERFAYLLGSITEAVLTMIESVPEFQGWPPVE
jgi:hypothetical protein